MNLSTISQLYDHPIIRNVEESSCEGSCVTKWKVIFAVILFIEGVFFGHIVYLIRRFRSNKQTESTTRFNTILSFGNALAAGVFLSTGFLHILPEAIELFSGEHAHGEEGHGEEGHGEEDGEEEGIPAAERNEEEGHDEDGPHEEGEESHSNSLEEGHEDEEEEGASFPTVFAIVVAAFYFFFFLEKILLPKIFGKAVTHNHVGDEHDSEEAPEQAPTDVEGEKLLDGTASDIGFVSTPFVLGLLTILGISAHSFIESMALGVSNSFTTALNIFIATASHRWATALAITFPLVRNLRYIPFLVLLLIFSAMIPLGVGIGAALSSISSTAQGVLFAISVGTFLYMGAYELMGDAFAGQRKWQFAKFITMLGGAGIIYIITGILTALDIHG